MEGPKKLHREALRSHNIYYTTDPIFEERQIEFLGFKDSILSNPSIPQSSYLKNPIFATWVLQLPSRVDALREILLDFTCILCESDKTYLASRNILSEARIATLKDSHWFHSVDNPNREDECKLYKRQRELFLWDCGETRKNAQDLNQRGYQENKWNVFFQKHIFNHLGRDCVLNEQVNRRLTRGNLFYEQFVLAENNLWTKIDDFRRLKPGLTTPKPDFVFHFPIYGLGNAEPPNSPFTRTFLSKSDLLKTNNLGCFPSLRKDQFVENFTSTILAELAKHGLEPSTRKELQKSAAGKMDESELYCYPWLIVELKKDNPPINAQEYCYCQAANAASGTLKMFENAARYAENKLKQQHVPPIVIMTAIGPEVRIWIAYSFNQSHEYPNSSGDIYGHHMACIWKGDMTITWDVIQLRTILNNLHTWAMRVLRPQLSMYIDQWKFRHLSGMDSQEIINLESTNAENVKHIQGVQSIVNGTQKRLDDLNIGQPDSSVEQFRLAALLQELFRAEHSKLLQELQKPAGNGSNPFAGIFAGISNKTVEPRAFPQAPSYVNANLYSEGFPNVPSIITDSQLNRSPIERSQHVQTRGGSTPSVVVHVGANREQKPFPFIPSLYLRNTNVLRDNDLQSKDKAYPGQRQRRDSPEPLGSKSSEFELTPNLAKPQPTPNPLHAIKVKDGYRIQVQGRTHLMRVRLPPGHLYDEKEYESVSVDEDWETNDAEEDSESISVDDDREADDEESEEDRETNDYERSFFSTAVAAAPKHNNHMYLAVKEG